MAEVRRVPSTVFRATYALLEESVAVTVLGRVIGWYIPASRPGQEGVAAPEAPGRPEAPLDPAQVLAAATGDVRPVGASPSPSGAVDALRPTTGMTQADRDAVLRKVAKR